MPTVGRLELSDIEGGNKDWDAKRLARPRGDVRGRVEVDQGPPGFAVTWAAGRGPSSTGSAVSAYPHGVEEDHVGAVHLPKSSAWIRW